jgi:hypothetical protein
MAFGCQRQRNTDRCGCECENTRECKRVDPCDLTPDDFCYEVLECNDCVIDHVGLAQAYIPYQTDFVTFSQEESLACGTIFPQLSIPYTRNRCPGRR